MVRPEYYLTVYKLSQMLGEKLLYDIDIRDIVTKVGAIMLSIPSAIICT